MLKLFRCESLTEGLRDGVIKGSGLMDLYLIGNTEPIERSVLREYPLLGDGGNVARENLLRNIRSRSFRSSITASVATCCPFYIYDSRR